MIGRNNEIFDAPSGITISTPHVQANSTVNTERSVLTVSKPPAVTSRDPVDTDARARVIDDRPPRFSLRFLSYQVALSGVVAVVLVMLLLQQVNGQDVLTQMKNIHARYLWPAVMCSLIGFALRAWRWRLLLRPIQSVRFSRLLTAELVGFTGNTLFPFRLGEALKGLTVSRLEGLPLSTVLGTLAAAGIFNVLALGLFFVSGVGMFPSLEVVPWIVGHAYEIGGVLLLSVGVGWLCLRHRPMWEVRRPTWAQHRWMKKLMDGATAFVIGLRCVRTPLRALVLTTLSFLLWLSLAGRFFFVIWALGLNLPLSAVVLVQAVVGAGTSVPVSPSQLGTFEMSTILGLRLFAVDEDTALACALLVRLTYFGPAVLLGLVCAARLGVRHWGSHTSSTFASGNSSGL